MTLDEFFNAKSNVYNGRAWFDPISYSMSTSGLSDPGHFDEMIKMGKVSAPFYASFIHEICHFWCYASPVGYALQALRFRAQHHCIAYGHGNTDAMFLWFRDTTIALCLESILQSLIEGIALFAEFDVILAHSPCISYPMISLASTMYPLGLFDPNVDPDFNRMHGRMAITHRTAPFGIKRKFDLLGRPITPQDGGYLMGYLAVKNLWRYQGDRFGHYLQDKDFFLSVLHFYFFHDLELVSIILSGGENSYSSLKEIMDYLSDRVFNIWRLISVDDLMSLERHFLDENKYDDCKNDRIPHLNALLRQPSFSADKSRRERGANLVIEAFSSLIGRTSAAQADLGTQVFLEFQNILLDQREVLCLARFEADIQLDQDGNLLARGEDWNIAPVSPLKGVNVSSGKGAVELLYLPNSHQVCRAISVGGHRVSSECYFGDQESADEMIRRASRDQFLVHQGARLFISDPNTKLTEWSSEKLNDMLSLSRDWTDRYFGMWAFMHVQQDHLKRTSEMCATTGLYDILGADREFMYGVAAFSLAASLTHHPRGIDSWLRPLGYSFEGIMKRSQQVKEEYGWPLFDEVSGIVVSNV